MKFTGVTSKGVQIEKFFDEDSMLEVNVSKFMKLWESIDDPVVSYSAEYENGFQAHVFKDAKGVELAREVYYFGAGSLDDGVPNHLNPEKRGFQPL